MLHASQSRTLRSDTDMEYCNLRTKPCHGMDYTPFRVVRSEWVSTLPTPSKQASKLQTHSFVALGQQAERQCRSKARKKGSSKLGESALTAGALYPTPPMPQYLRVVRRRTTLFAYSRNISLLCFQIHFRDETTLHSSTPARTLSPRWPLARPPTGGLVIH